MDIKTYPWLRKLFETPSSDTELRNDGSDPTVRLLDTAAAGRAIVDNARYAKEFSVLDAGEVEELIHKFYLGPKRFSDIPAAAGWGPVYSRKSTYMCMPLR
jgi:hypothetical protein